MLSPCKIASTHAKMSPTSATPNLKLLVDTKSQLVLYAEASEDAVDFLFSLLNMPVGDGGCTAGGSIFNLYVSTASKKLDAASSGGHGGAHEAAPTPPRAPAGAAMYTVMDDLKIAPLSTVSVITRLSALGVKDISALQEKTVQLGYAEGLEMLKASLQSKTVLTDIFIGRKCGFPSKRVVAKLVCGFLALPFICALVEQVTEGRRF